MQSLRIIDAVGPFIVPDAVSEVVNWSKVDFTILEKNGRLPPAIRRRIIRRFEQYLRQVTAMGYDSISLDDLAHLALLPAYGPSLQRLMHDYRLLYKTLFATADKHGVRVFLNSDFLFSNDEIQSYRQRNQLTEIAFFTEVVERVLQDFPAVAGVIVRIGEHDGMDVQGMFLSRIGLHSPQESKSLLEALLPVFEHHDKLLIFRTWTVGAYGIGDLIWNERTFQAVFDTIHSKALVISMKFGETDFMRSLQLNPLFFASHHQKIIELQTRREWEGMGMYPSFVGWDYQRYFDQLSNDPTIVGIHDWCQTGGWATKAWMNVTFLDKGSFWNELNTFVTVYMYRYMCTAEEAVGQFCTERNISDTAALLELLRLSDVAIHKGLYFPSLAKQDLYFRRIKIPTLLWISWDRVLAQPVLSTTAIVYSGWGVCPDRR